MAVDRRGKSNDDDKSWLNEREVWECGATPGRTSGKTKLNLELNNPACGTQKSMAHSRVNDGIAGSFARDGDDGCNDDNDES